MKRLGLAGVERMDILALFDLDGTGVMQKEEFLDMIRHSRERRDSASKSSPNTLCFPLVDKGQKVHPTQTGQAEYVCC